MTAGFFFISALVRYIQVLRNTSKKYNAAIKLFINSNPEASLSGDITAQRVKHDIHRPNSRVHVVNAKAFCAEEKGDGNKQQAQVE